LNRSPRSIRGTTRTTAYWNGLRDGTVDLDEERARGTQPRGQIVDVRASLRAGRAEPAVVGQPGVGDQLDDRGQDVAVQARREPRVGLDERPGERAQDVLAQPRERPPGVAAGLAPGVVDVERRTVVDQPRAAVPDDDVRVLRRPVGVRGVGVEPQDVGRELG
jgi:hypothetical protein